MSLSRRYLAVVCGIAGLAGTVCGATAQTLDPTPHAADTATLPAPETASESTLTLLSVDARTLPGTILKTAATAPAPQWRTSFGSERRSEVGPSKPASSVDADIVLLQGVSDVPALRRWFPAGQWRLVVSRQILSANVPAVQPIATTAVAVRLRRGLRITGQDHFLGLAEYVGQGAPGASAAATAVRILLDGRETWAISVLLPENCRPSCPGREALDRWHRDRERENVRRVTGGRFQPSTPGQFGLINCDGFGLRLDPAPPPPKLTFTKATQNPVLGCAASVAVAK